MFGYVTVNADTLSSAEKARFREVYCGVCKALKDAHGLCGQLTLSYDAAFLALLLNALYEPQEAKGLTRCKVHPAKKHPFAISDMTRYAADMNLMLCYYRCLDDWADDKNRAKLAMSKLIKPKALMVIAKYPRQAERVDASLKALAECERARADDIDAPANCFGALLGELFRVNDDIWADTLYRMGAALGRFIYLMDAWDDAKKDKKRGAFNPLASHLDDDDYEEQCKRILTMQIADCALEFEKLPIVSDINILRNVLYSGVWTIYVRKRKLQQGKEDGE